MFSEACAEGAAETSGSVHSYYVRLPAALAGALPAASAEEDGDLARLITEPMSVKTKHGLAKALREEGAALFFAAISQ